MDPKRYRNERKLTLRQVADMIGVRSAATVSKHERGHIFPSPEMIDAYRRYSGGKIQFEDFEDVRRRACAATATPATRKEGAHAPA